MTIVSQIPSRQEQRLPKKLQFPEALFTLRIVNNFALYKTFLITFSAARTNHSGTNKTGYSL